MRYPDAPPLWAGLDFDDDILGAARTSVLLAAGGEAGDDASAPDEILQTEVDLTSTATDPGEPIPGPEVDFIAYAAAEGVAASPDQAEVSVRTTKDGIPLAQILAERPDVYAGFFTAYFGPDNDHHSSAWLKRVGGDTPEDYANYWYETYGRFGDYHPGGGAAGAPLEEQAFGGRTTYDGIPLSQILHDRPDVYRAFFTEYYGPNNDRNSNAWVERVGGATPEDYANYWYEQYGWYQYRPTSPTGGAPADPDPPEQLDDVAGGPDPADVEPSPLPEREVYELPSPDDPSLLTADQIILRDLARPLDGWNVG